MNYCVKHNERCDFANASGHCSITACNRYLFITDKAQTVEAIPIEWIKKWISDRNDFPSIPYNSYILHMLDDWAERKEE